MLTPLPPLEKSRAERPGPQELELGGDFSLSCWGGVRESSPALSGQGSGQACSPLSYKVSFGSLF